MTTGKLFKDPRTTAQLKEIQDRNLDNEDVKALLWEIKRLRVYPLRLDQIRRSDWKVPSILIPGLSDDLDKEPIVQESLEWRKDMLEPPGSDA